MSGLAIESWTWYGLCCFVVGCRLLSRSMLQGSITKLQIDDALIVFAMCTFTALTVVINIVAKTNTNLINPDDPVLDFTPAVVKERSFGSKMVLVAEQCQILTIWTIKACLLTMYGRLTISMKQHLAVKVVAVYVALGFVVMEILYFGVWCRPFHEYWAVPTTNTQCSAATHHLITNAVFNISSDLMIVAIPMPVFLKAQLPLKKKAILCGVFGLGTFSILSAILNKFYSFTQPFGSLWTFWYIRESSTAILTANLPFTWTLLQRAFNISSFAGSSRGGRSRTTYHQFPNSNTTNPRKTVHDLEGNDSQEQIVSGDIPLEIWQNVQFTVHTSTASTDKKGVVVTESRADSPDDSSEVSNVGVVNANDAQVTTTCTHMINPQ